MINAEEARSKTKLSKAKYQKKVIHKYCEKNKSED